MPKRTNAKAKHARTKRRNRPLAAIVLAAGKGTRMRSDRAKVLHDVGGRPMVVHAVDTALAAGADPVVVVIGHQAPLMQAVTTEAFAGDPRIRFVVQEQQRGTADAVRTARPQLARFSGTVIITLGDVPLLGSGTLEKLIRASQAAAKKASTARRRSGAGLAIVTTILEDPFGYGRVVRGDRNRVVEVVEEKDATRAQREICEVNAGIFALPAGFLFTAIRAVRSTNRQRELYLTDLVGIAAEAGVEVKGIAADPAEVSGVNDRADIAAANTRYRSLRNGALMKAGVTMLDPETTYVEHGVAVERDVNLGPGVVLTGTTRLARGVRIGPYAVLHDTIVEKGATIRAHSVCDTAHVGPDAVVGPFARLRPGATLKAEVQVGNFVEVKKSVLGRGSKANHLAYLGDAEIGRKVNIGAGTITCNYDGEAKHRTVIADRVFIGSDVQLVAPVTVGRGAVIGAGSPITDDVPPGALAVARARQVVIEGYRKRKKRKPRGAGKPGSRPRSSKRSKRR